MCELGFYLGLCAKGDFKKTIFHTDYNTVYDCSMVFFFFLFSLYHFHVILEEFVDFKWDSILFSQQIIYKIRLRQNGQDKIPQINIFCVYVHPHLLCASS